MKAHAAFVSEQFREFESRLSQEQAALAQSSVSDTSLTKRINELRSHCRDRIANERSIQTELVNLKSRQDMERETRRRSEDTLSIP